MKVVILAGGARTNSLKIGNQIVVRILVDKMES